VKKLYGIQIFLGFLLYFIGYNLQEEQERLVAIFRKEDYGTGPYGEPSMYFAAIAGGYCLYCLLVALGTAQRLRRIGIAWSIASFCMGVFAVAMFSSPRGISLSESLWAWIIYIALGCGWVIIVYQEIDAAPLPQPIYEDEILDDL
jgi:lysylphosphatidylglycerol synthetase-like protein (DUF2156 family)